MTSKRLATIAVLLGLAALASCASQPAPSGVSDVPGFFQALFHGFAAPVTLVLGWLWDGRIYAFPNTGWFYDLGFMIGLGVWGGGAAASR
jgi:hypothetical protein